LPEVARETLTAGHPVSGEPLQFLQITDSHYKYPEHAGWVDSFSQGECQGGPGSNTNMPSSGWHFSHSTWV
jgi:hypothetical protein